MNSTDSSVPLDQIAQPWLKRRSEGRKAYAAFKIYFGLGEERSLEAVAKFLKKHKSQIGGTRLWPFSFFRPPAISRGRIIATMKNTDPKQRKAWEKSPREHIRAYAAAKEYFDLGAERSLDKVAHRLQKSLGLMKRWSTRNHWGQRAAAYDRWCNRIKQQELEDQRRQTAQRWGRARRRAPGG